MRMMMMMILRSCSLSHYLKQKKKLSLKNLFNPKKESENFFTVKIFFFKKVKVKNVF